VGLGSSTTDALVPPTTAVVDGFLPFKSQSMPKAALRYFREPFASTAPDITSGMEPVRWRLVWRTPGQRRITEVSAETVLEVTHIELHKQA
jgi:hypothetical protein